MDSFLASIQLAVGIVFVFSGASKLIRPRKFFRGLVDYQLFPQVLLKPVSAVVIAWELAIGYWHLANKQSVATSALTICLLVLFMITVVRLIGKNGQNEVPCLCFGFARDGKLSASTVARISLLVVAELLLLLFTPKGGYLSDALDDALGVAAIAFLLMFASYWVSLMPTLMDLMEPAKDNSSHMQQEVTKRNSSPTA